MNEERINLTDRQDFAHKVFIDPADYALGVSKSIDINTMDQRLLQVYVRFWNEGYIHRHGDKCFFMSHLLRRILRLHGIEAHVKQVTLFYSHKDKGWRQVVGEPMNITHGGSVDSHCVVITDKYLLDFSLLTPIHWAMSVQAPAALIGKSTHLDNDVEQDFGKMGQAIYTVRRPHRHTKHIVYEEREGVLEYTKKYFEKYRM